jgi:hypothetical protein
MSYCLEMISAQPHRRHTIGILLCEWQFRLVYHCRAFVAVSEAFDIRHDRPKFVVAVAALWTANLETLGFNPHFVNAQGLISIRPEECLVTIDKTQLNTKGWLYRARGLLGRGTGVLSASVSDTGRGVIVKLNTPPRSREVEADLLVRANKIPNIIKIVCFAMWGNTLDGFGPDFVKLVGHFEVREFRALVVYPHCQPFDSIPQLEMFKNSFVKLVIGARSFGFLRPHPTHTLPYSTP